MTDDTPPASPAATDEAPCRHEWYLGKCAHCERTVSEVRASPAATDEDVAKMVERLLHDCSRIGEPHDHMIMAQAADLLARVARERDRFQAMTKHMVGLSDDGATVFIDGFGDVALDYDDARLKRAEAAEKALALLVADVADYPAWQRPCHALDVARAHLAKHAGGNNG